MPQIVQIELFQFLKIRKKLSILYAGLVQGLDNQLETLLEPSKNTWFGEGGDIAFYMVEDKGRAVACASAFIKSDKEPKGYFGFFHVPDSQYITRKLLSACEFWIASKGCNTLLGPANPGQRHQFWGSLADNFETPFWGMSYNPRYQTEHLLSSDMEVDYEQHVLLRTIAEELPEQLIRLHSLMRDRYALTYKSLDEMDLEFAIDCFTEVYNRAWVEIETASLTRQEAKETFEELKDILDPKLLWFAFAKEKPIGFFLSIPNIAEGIPEKSAKLSMSTKLSLFWKLSNHRFNKVIGLVFGIVPEFQDKAVSAGLIISMQHALLEHRSYQNIELNWVGSFNPGMLNLVEKIGFKKNRKLLSFKKDLSD